MTNVLVHARDLEFLRRNSTALTVDVNEYSL